MTAIEQPTNLNIIKTPPENIRGIIAFKEDKTDKLPSLSTMPSQDEYKAAENEPAEKSRKHKKTGLISKIGLGALGAIGVLVFFGSRSSGALNDKYVHISAKLKYTFSELLGNKVGDFIFKAINNTNKIISNLGDARDATTAWVANRIPFVRKAVEKLNNGIDSISKFNSKKKYEIVKNKANRAATEIGKIFDKNGVKTDDIKKLQKQTEALYQGFEGRFENTYKKARSLNEDIEKEVKTAGFFKFISNFAKKLHDERYIKKMVFDEKIKAQQKIVTDSLDEITTDLVAQCKKAKRKLNELNCKDSEAVNTIQFLINRYEYICSKSKTSNADKIALNKIIIETIQSTKAKLSKTENKELIDVLDKITQDLNMGKTGLIENIRKLALENVKDKKELQKIKGLLDEIQTGTIKAIDFENEELIERLSVSSIGGNILDVFGPLIGIGLIIKKHNETKDEKERKRLMFEHHMPILSGILTWFYLGPIKCLTGAKSMVAALSTGIVINKVGEVLSDKIVGPREEDEKPNKKASKQK